MIRFFVRWAFRMGILLLVLAVALILLKDVLGKALVEARVRTQTGMDVKIGKLELGLLSPALTIENLKLYNTAEFGGSPMVDIPDLHLLYDLSSLARGRLHLKLARVALAEIDIVEGKSGRTNLVIPDLATAPMEGGRRGVESLFGLEFEGIDTLNLTLGKVKYSSLRQPGKATELKLGLKNEIITNIKTLSQLRESVLTALFRNGITIMSPAPAERPAVERKKRPTGNTPRPEARPASPSR